ncbi:MAG: c-type cytochrome [Myxococcales bacterium]
MAQVGDGGIVDKRTAFSWLFPLVLLGCGGHPQEASAASSSGGGEETSVAPSAPQAPQTFADQVALGGDVYGRACAACHGAAGEGAKAPAVVGLSSGALPLAPHPGSQRTSQFVTVADVANFVVATMPPKAPGSLSGEEYWAILAFDLSANGITLEQKLTPELAATLTIPR